MGGGGDPETRNARPLAADRGARDVPPPAGCDCPHRGGRYLDGMADDTLPRDGTDLSVYYDGGCPLCRAEIGHYRQCEGADRLRFVDVGSGAPGVALGAGLDREAALRRFHVRDADGHLVSGAAAFARLWRTLPNWRWLGRLVDLKVLGIRPILPIAEVAYRAFLPLRPRLASLLTRLRR